MIGFEVELDRRVADASGAKIKGDEKLATCAGGEFTVVADTRNAKEKSGTSKTIYYSNIELVTSPFDQMTGDVAAIQKALQHMSEFAGHCYKTGAATPLRDVLGHCGLPYILTQAGMGAVVHPDTDIIGPVEGLYYRVADGGPGNLFVHYTVGFPVLQLPAALEWLTGKVRPQAENKVTTFPITNAQRASRAGLAAAELFRRWSQLRKVDCVAGDAAALAGYVALVYTQLAATVDRSYKPEGQIKNKTIVVCRVPLRNVAGVLPARVQQFLREQAWADMLNDYRVGKTDNALLRFLNARTKEAGATASGKQASAAAAKTELTKLEQLISAAEGEVKAIENALAMLPEHEDPTKLTGEFSRIMAELDTLRAEAGKRRDIVADYTDCETASQQWTALQAGLPTDLVQVNVERIAGQFPWSVIGHAIVPALEGRLLADDLPSKAVDRLFAGNPVPDGSAAPDKGIARGLATGTQSDMDGDPVTFGQYLYSALLAPGQRTLGPTKIFGGMHEVAQPDVFTGSDGIKRHLVPLELRSHGPQQVTWEQLGAALEELVNFSLKLAS